MRLAILNLVYPQFTEVTGYEYIIAKNRFGTAVALIWDAERICQLSYREAATILKEVQAAGLSVKKIRVYGLTSTIFGENFEFIQLPLTC
jgi:hypothetical protein